ncbi:hypothetical protein [Lactiplantibacillus mudanjiangensis]|uniref:Uncharacterized protein n=1 Tax=Lactiplantibacillus mudanjiangensis TaxID=1296538 RepID=A0A660E8D5_9LACO|nr:hypothetical protein [Lactiplantibacillus mudanjiangensis]VDG23473.1 hypothetical protein [Lactobacillus sp. CBA3606] [Lactiplantibacillus mudanjiangensis]VDG29381.1 hypothetical protein [Lactobacillus sp. CBA3606] [Lactiplantibacillus mudanjiangensis]VDG32757.1 hypothetical protein [Lactobacillus sp. CBA3606] [Lactiplantibacillus mudanjiangensis]
MDTKYDFRRYRNKQQWPATETSYDLTDLAGLVSRSERLDGAQVDYLQTFFVLDTSQLAVEVNAVILDSQRGIISTIQTVPQLMRQVALKLRFGAQQQLRELVDSLGLTPFKLPLICGDMQFIPMTFRHFAGRHWFGAHQFNFATTLPTGTGTLLQLWNGLHLALPVSKRALGHQVQRAKVLQQRLAADRAYYDRFNYGGAIGGQRLAPELVQASYRNFSQHLNVVCYDAPLDHHDLEETLADYFVVRV